MQSCRKFLPLIMWLLPVLFFAYQFILRLWPGIMSEQIMAQYSMNALEFGTLASFYYYGYAGMQIPVAILLDKFGARKIVSIFAILTGIATLLFTYSNNIYIAFLSRFLIGAGSAVGILGVSKVISEYFPKNQYAKMMGFSVTLGLIGAIYGGKPISLLIDAYRWEAVAITLGFVAIGIGFLVFLALRGKPSIFESVPESSYSFKSLKTVLWNPFIWLLGLSNLLMVGALEGFADVWGVRYLMTSFSIDKSTAAGLTSFIFVGMLTGGPLLAYFSKKIGEYSILFLSGVGLTLLFLFLFSLNFYSWYGLALIFFIIGNFCCYQIIVFAAGARLVPDRFFGVAVAFLNCINMLGGSFFHTLIGKLMDVFWNGGLSSNGTRVYDLHAFNHALNSIPIASAIGAFIILFVAVYLKKYSFNSSTKLKV